MWHHRTRPGFTRTRRQPRLEGLEDRCVLAVFSPLSPQLLVPSALSQQAVPILAPAGGNSAGSTPGGILGGLLGGNGTQGPAGGLLGGTPIGQTPGLTNLPGTTPGGGTGALLPGTLPGTSGLPNTPGNGIGNSGLAGQPLAGNVGGQPGVSTVGATTVPNFFPQTGPNNGIDNLQDSQIVLLMNRRVNETSPGSAVGNRPNEGLLLPGEAQAVNPTNRATIRSLAVLSGGNDQPGDEFQEDLPAEESPAPQWFDGVPQPQVIPQEENPQAMPALPQMRAEEPEVQVQVLDQLLEQAGEPGRELSALLAEPPLESWAIGLVVAGVGIELSRRPLSEQEDEETRRARRRRRQRALDF